MKTLTPERIENSIKKKNMTSRCGYVFSGNSRFIHDFRNLHVVSPHATFTKNRPINRQAYIARKPEKQKWKKLAKHEAVGTKNVSHRNESGTSGKSAGAKILGRISTQAWLEELWRHLIFLNTEWRAQYCLPRGGPGLVLRALGR